MYRCNSCGADYIHYDAYKEFHKCPNAVNDEELKKPKDPLEVRPDHYKVGGIEPWDYMETKMTPEQFEGFLLGNVIKYVSRYPEKNGLEDLKKARTYLDRLIGVYDRFNV